MKPVFASRREAGRLLGERLGGRLGAPAVVVAVGDAGAVVAEAAAAELGAAVGVWGVLPLVVPWRTRWEFGAVTDDNHHYVDPALVSDHALGVREIGQMARERLQALRAEARRARPDVRGAHVAVVAESLSTGYRALAVVAAVKAQGAATVLVATPCAAADAAVRVEAQAPAVVLALSDAARFDPAAFFAA